MKTLFFTTVAVAQLAALQLTLPFQLQPVVAGDNEGTVDIDVADIARLQVRLITDGETGIGRLLSTTGANRYELDGTNIVLHVANADPNVLQYKLTISGAYGQVKLNATIVLDVKADGEASIVLNQYVFSAIAAGGGGADYRTNVYMDGDGRVIVERLEDGSTMILDEHENSIVKRNADGSTVFFDAYQSERMRINAHGDVDFNADVTGAGMLRVELVYDSATNTIKLGGVVQTYAQVDALITDTGNFVTLQDGDDTSFLLPHYGDGAAIIFTGLDVFSDGDYSHRIAINSENDVKREYFAIQRRKEAEVITNDVTEVMLNRDDVVIADARTADLTVTLPYMAPKGEDFHMFIAVAGTPTITWPAGISWANDDEPTIESGKTYEVSFFNNSAAYLTYENV